MRNSRVAPAAFRLPVLLMLLAIATVAAPAAAKGNDAQTAWRLLDYLSVDYAGAVSGGKIVSQSEYDEMREFSGSVQQRLGALPPTPAKPALLSGSAKLRSAIDHKASADEVAGIARQLGRDLLKAYPVPLGPRKAPDAELGNRLYAQNCASCHGLDGRADTPAARQLDPPPVAFADRGRASERSPFALYQVIDQGLEGTAMTSFSNLPAEQKWALAYHVAGFAYPAALAAKGKGIWEQDSAVRQAIPDLDALSGLSEQALARQVGSPEKAAAVIAYLRANPDAVSAGSGSPLATGRRLLQQSLAAYEAGNRDQAKDLALAAYLDGFEPVEATLGARDGTIVARVETAMGGLRSAIAKGADPADVRQRIGAISSLFDEAEAALAPDRDSAASTFIGAFTILFREGLEALLIVVGMLAFLRKGGRAEMTRPVHVGWTSALVAGGLTWWAATGLIEVSGASRELTEGFGSLLAAAVLLFVGIWMHGKSQADEWQRYIKHKVGQALSRKSGWFLFMLAFIAVYREVFETILFFAAMAQQHPQALVGGAVAGGAALAIIAVAMLKFSQRLPIAKFFAYSSALVAVLAVVLAGKGVAALQESGMVGVDRLSWVPRFPMLGIFPTAQGIITQVATLAILIAGFAWNQRESRRLAAV
jgi:high-affinity iron transporter